MSLTSPRIGLFLLLSFIVLIALPYFDASVPKALIGLALAIPFVLGVFSPALSIAVVLGVAPLIDGIAALLIHGNPLLHQRVGIGWTEPIFLGVSAGILTRLAFRNGQKQATPSAAYFYTAAIGGALALSLTADWSEWRSHFPQLLEMMWRSLPNNDQLSAEHVLRAGLLLLAVPLWLGLIHNAMSTREDVRRAWLFWLGGALVTAAYGTWKWWRDGRGLVGYRIESVLDDVNSYGSYLALTFFIALAMLESERSRMMKGFAAVVLASTAWMLFLSASKVALAATLLCSCLLILWGIGGKRLLLAVGTVLIGVIAVVGVWGTIEQNVPLRRLREATIRASNPSFLLGHFRQNRQAVWSATTRAFLDRPVFGIGPGLLYQNLGHYYRPGDSGWQPATENGHCYFLQLAAETGLLGFLGFMGLLWVSLRPAFTASPPESSVCHILATGALAYLATMVTGHPLLLSRQLVLFWGFVGLVSVASAPSEPSPAHAPGSFMRLSAWVVPPLFLAAALWGLRAHPCPPRPETQQDSISWDFAAGFYNSERSATTTWRWMKSAGQMRFCNVSGKTLISDLTFRAASFAQPRHLTVYSRGQQLVDLSVPTGLTSFTVPNLTLRPGLTTLIFSASPGPQQVDPILHNGDQRHISLQFLDPAISLRSPP